MANQQDHNIELARVLVDLAAHLATGKANVQEWSVKPVRRVVGIPNPLWPGGGGAHRDYRDLGYTGQSTYTITVNKVGK